MTDTIQYDLFIVYANRDIEWVEKVLIPSVGLPSERIFTKEKFTPSADKITGYERAVRISRYTLLILTQAFFADVWARYGGAIASYSRVKQQHDRLLLLILRPCELPQHLDQIVSFDCTNEARWQREIERLRNLLNQTEAPLDFRDYSPPIVPSNEVSSGQYTFELFPKNIEQLIGDGEVESALKKLANYLMSIDAPQDLQNEVTLFRSRYNRLRKAEQQGRITFEVVDTKINQLSREILRFLEIVVIRTSMKISSSLISSQRSDKSLKESVNRYSVEPKLPSALRNRIVDFLSSIPNMHDSDARWALVCRAGLDTRLQYQIKFDLPSAQFFQLLVEILRSYGELEDGRNPIKSLLEATKVYIGQDRKTHCDTLIEELRGALN